MWLEPADMVWMEMLEAEKQVGYYDLLLCLQYFPYTSYTFIQYNNADIDYTDEGNSIRRVSRVL